MVTRQRNSMSYHHLYQFMSRQLETRKKWECDQHITDNKTSVHTRQTWGSSTSVLVLKSDLSSFSMKWSMVLSTTWDQLKHLCSSWIWIKLHHNLHNFAFESLPKTTCISTIVHAMTKLFVPFCSAQDDESTDINCLVFWEYCKNGKILMKHKVYIIRRFSQILGIFS